MNRYVILYIMIVSCLLASSTAIQSRPLLSTNMGPSLYAWNYIGVTHHIPLSKRFSSYFTGGIGSVLVGLGIDYQYKPNETSPVAAFTVGFPGVHFHAGYQYRLSPTLFMLTGIGAGYHFPDYNVPFPFFCLQYYFDSPQVQRFKSRFMP